MTYNELVTNIRNYTEVDANVFSEPVINTFIELAENRILRDIDLDVFKKSVTGTFTSSNPLLASPADLLTHRYLLITDNNGVETFLEFRDPSFMKEFWPDPTQTGFTKFYSVWDQDNFYVAPTPANSYTFELGYVYRPAQLSSSNPTTWISTKIPEALLYACLIQAYSYTKGPLEMLSFFNTSYTDALQGVGVEQQGRRRRDEYRDGMARIPVKSVSPGP
jgi:hypothetical protein